MKPHLESHSIELCKSSLSRTCILDNDIHEDLQLGLPEKHGDCDLLIIFVDQL